MDELLRIEHLKKYFNTPRGLLHAVDDVSFSLEKGKTLGVVGESGCGKSTLGRTILGLIDATDGHVFFDGRDITNVNKNDRRNLRREMQIIFQDPYASLDPRMCVSELIADPLQVFKVYRSKAELNNRVRELMDTVGLAERLEFAYPHELDGGRRQRVGIARALALNPKFIVCDEPVSALDVSIQAQILNLLQDLQAQMKLSYMFVTHDMSVVKHISDDILVMYTGCVVEFCNKRDLFRNPLHPYTQGLLSAIPIPNIHQTRKRVIMSGEITSPIDPKPGCRFAARCPYATDVCRSTQPQLIEQEPKHFVACHNLDKVAAKAGY